jgi:DNA modification methylase
MSTHQIFVANSKNLSTIKDNSINLIVTSPPYPMIQMWDDSFIAQDNSISEDLKNNNINLVFHKMHGILNTIWEECNRVLKVGGFICINIGDATRTFNNKFQLFSNHTQIINYFFNKGYSVLPDILWRKQSNSPTKFMGSGMLPAGAYITYEHEYILIFRKGEKRDFSNDEKLLRQQSAYFWEERNTWFSDLWDIKGISQILQSSRNRSASFPLEIPYRLINMFSLKNDIILDPFAGLGTTNLACMISNRNSIGIEIDNNISELAIKNLVQPIEELNKIIDSRIEKHLNFIKSLPAEKRTKCYTNTNYNFPVKTKQEINLRIDKLIDLKRNKNIIECSYS